MDSFVNLKKTVSDFEHEQVKNRSKMNRKSQIKDHFQELLPNSFMKSHVGKNGGHQVFGRTNEVFKEKIGVSESQVIGGDDGEWGEVVRTREKKEKCNKVVEACTVDMFQFLLNEVLEELAQSN